METWKLFVSEVSLIYVYLLLDKNTRHVNDLR